MFPSGWYFWALYVSYKMSPRHWGYPPRQIHSGAKREKNPTKKCGFWHVWPVYDPQRADWGPDTPTCGLLSNNNFFGTTVDVAQWAKYLLWPRKVPREVNQPHFWVKKIFPTCSKVVWTIIWPCTVGTDVTTNALFLLHKGEESPVRLIYMQWVSRLAFSCRPLPKDILWTHCGSSTVGQVSLLGEKRGQRGQLTSFLGQKNFPTCSKVVWTIIWPCTVGTDVTTNALFLLHMGEKTQLRLYMQWVSRLALNGLATPKRHGLDPLWIQHSGPSISIGRRKGPERSTNLIFRSNIFIQVIRGGWPDWPFT